MLRLTSLSALAFALVAPYQALAEPVQWKHEDGGNGHYYDYVPGSLHWANARTAAESLTFEGFSGHLATLTSEAEKEFLRNQVPRTDWRAWLGGFQDTAAPDYSEPAGGWRWITGELWDYTHWGTIQPDNYYRGQDFLQIDIGAISPDRFGWDDIEANDHSNGYYVEFPVPEASIILGRHIFYNNSVFDDPSDDAIATDKTALLPGETATFDNYTSYDLGINGIMIDIVGLADPDALNRDTIGDHIQLRVGNNDDADTWSDAPEVRAVNVRPDEGENGSDRISLTWTDRAISNEWLQVTVLANELTGLEEDDVFYFGNAVAEAGNSDVDTQVTVTDLLLARNNTRNFLDPAEIDFPYDYNRDQRVGTTDLLLARNNATNFLTDLNLITVPGDAGAVGANVVPEPGCAALLACGLLGFLAFGWRRRRRPVAAMIAVVVLLAGVGEVWAGPKSAARRSSLPPPPTPLSTSADVSPGCLSSGGGPTSIAPARGG